MQRQSECLRREDTLIAANQASIRAVIDLARQAACGTDISRSVQGAIAIKGEHHTKFFGGACDLGQDRDRLGRPALGQGVFTIPVLRRLRRIKGRSGLPVIATWPAAG